MKYLIILFFSLFAAHLSFGQFGACGCTATIANNSGVVQFTTLTWTGAGPCPTAATTTHTGNLCINLGGNSVVVFNQTLTVNGDLKVTTTGSSAVIRVPQGTTLTVNGDLGEPSNNNAEFEIDGALIVSNGIYGNNNNQFDASGTGTGSVTAGTISMGNNVACVSPTNCSGINWNVTTCSPPASTFCQAVTVGAGTQPVSLLYFETRIESNKIDFLWATATERNSSHFIIERSIDGKTFKEISRTNASGNSSLKIEYTAHDSSPLIGRSYYRLKEVDFDGKTENFTVKVVDYSGKKAISVYPNPLLSENDELTIALNFSTDENAMVKITDLAGHEVKRLSFSGSVMQIPFKPEKGAYIVTVTSAGNSYSTRLVVR